MDSHSKNLMFKDQRKAHFPALVSEQAQRPQKKEEIPFEKKKKKKQKVVQANLENNDMTPLSLIQESVQEAM